jgi:glycosyltransferase involved in cell wall biosynthesis
MSGRRRNKRVALAHAAADRWSGREDLAMAVAATYRQVGYDVCIWVPVDGDFAEDARDEGYRVSIVCADLSDDGIWPRTRAACTLWQAGLRFRPDVIHTTSGAAIRTLTPLAKMIRARLVAQLQTMRDVDLARDHRVEQADVLLPISDAVAAPLRDYLGRSSRRPRLAVVPPPLSQPAPDILQRADLLAATWRRHADEILVGVAGALAPRRGQLVFLSACADLRRRGYDIRPVVIGDPAPGHESYADDLRSFARARGLLDHVLWVPAPAHLPDHLAALDILTVPSISDGLGLVAGEALLAGTAVVASRVGGLPSLVEHGVSGLLVQPGNAMALADAVEELLVQPEWRDTLAASGYLATRSSVGMLPFGDRLLAEMSGDR